MVTIRQGDLWWAEAEDKRRPVLIVTRSEAAAVLDRIVVAPVTRTIRDIPTEIPIEPGHGLEVECVASADNLQLVHKRFLTSRIGSLPLARPLLCSALAAMADC